MAEFLRLTLSVAGVQHVQIRLAVLPENDDVWPKLGTLYDQGGAMEQQLDVEEILRRDEVAAASSAGRAQLHDGIQPMNAGRE